MDMKLLIDTRVSLSGLRRGLPSGQREGWPSPSSVPEWSMWRELPCVGSLSTSLTNYWHLTFNTAWPTFPWQSHLNNDNKAP